MTFPVQTNLGLENHPSKVGATTGLQQYATGDKVSSTLRGVVNNRVISSVIG